MDTQSYYDLPEQSLTDLIQLSHDHPDKNKLFHFITCITRHDFSHLPLQHLLTRMIHLCAKHQQENLFWLIWSVCQRAPDSTHFKITEQKNQLGDCVIHSILRSPHPANLLMLEGLLSHDGTLLKQLNHLQETPLHVFLNTRAFNSPLRETLAIDFLNILTQENTLLIYNKIGYASLHLCAFYGLDKELDRLLTLFPDKVDFPSAKNNTCLLIAVKKGHVNTIDILLKHHANLQAKTDKKHNTALHIAAKKGHSIICEKLLLAGLDPIKNNQDLTPIDMAKKNHHHQSLAILLQHENKKSLLTHPRHFTPFYSTIHPKELTLNTFLMGITLGHELAYQKIPEGKLVAIKNELNETALFYVHTLYDFSGLISYVFIPHTITPDKLIEIYVSFQGTSDISALERDLEHKGPGYHSYKQHEPELISKFFNILSPLFNTHSGKISITIAGHSLGGGDSFYFLQSLLKIMVDHLPLLSSESLTHITEALIQEKNVLLSDEEREQDIIEITHTIEKLLFTKPLIPHDNHILNLTRLRIIALNPVGLPKSTDYALEGLIRYMNKQKDLANTQLKIDAFILHSDGDFAQRMGDKIPLCDIPVHYANVNLLLVPGDSFAIQKAAALYLGAASLNPSNAPTTVFNVTTDMIALGALGGVLLGPLGLLLGLTAGGSRLHLSDSLKKWGKQVVWQPHTTLLPDISEDFNLDPSLDHQKYITAILEKVQLLKNITPEACTAIREIGHNLNTSTFEQFMTDTSKQQLAETLKAMRF